MFKVNRVVLAGNLTRDIEIRYTTAQRAFARFTVAVNRSVKQSDGSYKDTADFIPVAVWGKTAENCQRYLRKGDNVLVEGRISTRSYEVNGEKKFSVEVLADTVQFPPRNTQSGEPLRNGYGNGYSNQNDGYSNHTAKSYREDTQEKSGFSADIPDKNFDDAEPLTLGDGDKIPF